MDISALVPSSDNSIQKTSATNTRLIRFSKGQFVVAKVQRVVDSLAWLDIAGITLKTRTEIPLQAREQVLLEVTKADPAEITLRLIGQATPSNTEGELTAATSGNDLKSLLVSWGIEADDVNLNIAKALLTYGGNISPEDIESVRAQWLMTNSYRPADLTTLAYLYTKQLPISNETIVLANQWLSQSPQIAQRLHDLQLAMADAYAQLSPIIDNPPALNRLFNDLEIALAKIANWSISAGTPTAEIASRLADLIPKLNTPPESQLINSSSIRNQLVQQSVVDGSNVKGASPTILIENDSTVQSTGMSILAMNQPQLTAQQPADNVINPLHRLVGAVAETLSNLDLDKPTAKVLHRLADQLDTFSKELGSVQLSNLTTPLDVSIEPDYLFPIPLTSSDGPRTAHLKVFRRSGQEAIDPKNLRIALLLDLPELGEMAINLTIYEQRLGGQFLSGREETQRLIEVELNKLHDGLKALGYQIDSLTSDSLSVGEDPDWAPGVQLNSMDFPLPQINLEI